MLSEAAVNIARLAAVMTTRASALQSGYPHWQNKKARFMPGLDKLAPRAGLEPAT